MQRPYLLILIVFFVGCGSYKKKTAYSTNKSFNTTRTVSVDAPDPASTDSYAKEGNLIEIDAEIAAANTSIANSVINTALTFSGTRYKFGGTTKNGMDCSGLLFVAFGQHDVLLPRISHEMANSGMPIKLKRVNKGDLLFFKTTRRSKRINHVGLVVAVENDDIKFIHASTSRGVIVSSLREGYWNAAFVKATRVL